MPKVEIEKVVEKSGSRYPKELGEPCRGRHVRALGDAVGLTQFGANLTRVEPGCWSSLRHWHEEEDEFLIMVSGELVLVEDGGETVLRQGDCAGFPKNDGNGHHMVNRSDKDAVFLVVGTRPDRERCHYSDADLLYVEEEGWPRYTTRSGELLVSLGPMPERKGK